jgi:hypothetical protein
MSCRCRCLPSSPDCDINLGFGIDDDDDFELDTTTGTGTSSGTLPVADASTDTGSSTDTPSDDPERLRLIFAEETMEGTRRLYWIDYEDGPIGVPELVHEPLAANETVAGFHVSADRRWIAYLLQDTTTALTRGLLTDLSAPAFPSPWRFDDPLTPEMGRIHAIMFSPDSRQLGFTWSSDLEGPHELFVVELDTATSEPVRITPPVPAAGGVFGAPVFSPDSQRIAYVADLDGSGATELFVQYADAAAPGEPVQVSMGGASDPWWSPQSDVLLYRFDYDDDEVAEFFTVDVSGTPSEAAVHDPGDGGMVGAVSLAPDGRALVYWLGEQQESYGDIYYVPIEGAFFGSAVMLNEASGQGWLRRTEWAPDSSKLLFLSADEGPVQSWLLTVDDGPGMPIAVDVPLPPESNVHAHAFDPTGTAAYVFSGNADLQPYVSSALHRARLVDDGIDMLGAIEVDDAAFSMELIFSDGGEQALFTASGPSPMSLYWFDASDDNPTPVRLSPATGLAAMPNHAPRFSPGASLVFFAAGATDRAPNPLFAVSPGDPEHVILVGGEGFVRSVEIFTLP